MKQSVIWNKITEKLPEDGKTYLVWTGHEMIVSMAHVYDAARRKELSDLADDPAFVNQNEALKKSLKSATGKFADFGLHWYFDNPKIYWAELPLAPGETNPPPKDPFEGMVSRDVYLTKDGEIVGIHAIGDEHEGQFYQMEIWGNVYNEDHEMQGRGSFRVFDTLENEVKNWEADGWVRRDPPKPKVKA